VYVAGARRAIRRVLLADGVRPLYARFKKTASDALASARKSGSDVQETEAASAALG
jgi:hypothetical protein